MLLKRQGEPIMKTTVAVPVNGSSQAVALDFCTAVFVIVIEDGRVTATRMEVVNETMPSLRVNRLREMIVDVVLCGAISDPLSMMLWHCGIKVYPGLTGSVEGLIGAYIGNKLVGFQAPDFRPGFRRSYGCGKRRRFHGGRDRRPENNN
jgi:predicted Fe-Mo cluster-binding NifX family protein